MKREQTTVCPTMATRKRQQPAHAGRSPRSRRNILRRAEDASPRVLRCVPLAAVRGRQCLHRKQVRIHHDGTTTQRRMIPSSVCFVSWCLCVDHSSGQYPQTGVCGSGPQMSASVVSLNSVAQVFRPDWSRRFAAEPGRWVCSESCSAADHRLPTVATKRTPSLAGRRAWNGLHAPTGSRTVMRVPRPGSLWHSMRPPWASTIRLTVGSPRPLPAVFVE
jgi:hypothetical protein